MQLENITIGDEAAGRHGASGWATAGIRSLQHTAVRREAVLHIGRFRLTGTAGATPARSASNPRVVVTRGCPASFAFIIERETKIRLLVRPVRPPRVRVGRRDSRPGSAVKTVEEPVTAIDVVVLKVGVAVSKVGVLVSAIGAVVTMVGVAGAFVAAGEQMAQFPVTECGVVVTPVVVPVPTIAPRDSAGPLPERAIGVPVAGVGVSGMCGGVAVREGGLAVMPDGAQGTRGTVVERRCRAR